MEFKSAYEIRIEINKIINQNTNLKDVNKTKLHNLIDEYGYACANEREMDLNEG